LKEKEYADRNYIKKETPCEHSQEASTT
jgi:hypothetical protein